MRWTAAAAVLMVALAGPVCASYLTGNALMEAGDGTKAGEPQASVVRYSDCVGYLAGIVDATDTWTDWEYMGPQVCLQTGVTVEQLRQVVLRYMREYPEQWHLTAGSFVLNAYREAWPCP